MRLHKWLSGWENFNQLDELVVLAHLLNVLSENNIPIKKSEIKRCFNLHYNRDFHGGSLSYLKWLVSISKKKQKSNSGGLSEVKVAMGIKNSLHLEKEQGIKPCPNNPGGKNDTKTT